MKRPTHEMRLAALARAAAAHQQRTGAAPAAEPTAPPARPKEVPPCDWRGSLLPRKPNKPLQMWYECDHEQTPLRKAGEPNEVCACMGCGPKCRGYEADGVRSAARNFPPVETRHLLYHVYPRRGSKWRERILRLRERIGLFNGRRLVAAAVDATTDGADHVRDALAGCGCEVIEVPNDPSLREVASHAILFGRLAELAGTNDPTHATLYAHAKGATRPAGATCHRWAEVLEDVMLGHFPAVADALATHPVAGCFKKIGPGWKPSESASRWHYSGSWFWFRNAELFARDWHRIDRFWSGIEPYPSLHFSEAEAGCVFHAAPVPKLNLYDARYWLRTVEPELAGWRAANCTRRTRSEVPDWFPGDAAGWLTVEEGALLRELATDKRVLEIGSFAGRSTVCLARTAASVECIDPFDARGLPQPRDTYPEFRGNLTRYGVADRVTARRGTTEAVAPLLPARRYDLVFVDGDHGAPFVRTDLRAALRALAPGGTIAVHDYDNPLYPDVAAVVREFGFDVERVVGMVAVCRPPHRTALSVIVPTRDRPGPLARALASVAPQLLPGDEVITVADATGDWGATPRTSAMGRAAGDYLVFLDDDDELTADALAAIRAAVAESPSRPHLFRMRRGPQGDHLPGPKEVGEGNVSSQMFVTPNDPAKLGTWGTRYEGDCDFIRSTLASYPPDALVWRDEVIAVWRPDGEPK